MPAIYTAASYSRLRFHVAKDFNEAVEWAHKVAKETTLTTTICGTDGSRYNVYPRVELNIEVVVFPVGLVRQIPNN